MDRGFIQQEIIRVLKGCYDPEIPVDIYELGLIYKIDLDDDFNLIITMTLTSPACPVAETLPEEIKTKLTGIAGLKSVKIKLVWEPIWTQEMMSESARLELGMF